MERKRENREREGGRERERKGEGGRERGIKQIHVLKHVRV
jgi:hypothetical protein